MNRPGGNRVGGARRRRQPLLVFVIVLVVLAGVLVAADRIVAAVVESQVASRLQTQLASVAAPDVTVDGFPFVTQAVAGDLLAVHVVADGINSAPGQPEGAVRIAHTDLRLTDVRSPDWYTTVTAGSVEGTAELDYAAISALAGYPVSYADDNRVQVDVERMVLGVRVNAAVTGVLTVDAATQTLTITDPKSTFARIGVSDNVTRAVLDLVVKPIPLTGIPLGLQVNSLTPTGTSVVVGIAGSDVPLTG